MTGKGLVRRNVFMRENRRGARPGWEEGGGDRGATRPCPAPTERNKDRSVSLLDY